ncbi:MAG: aldo/keto reductase [Lachnospiraceae bacterium]|nr:aldo/keto reductase [Lachnospiraceae bacterium]
MKLILGTMTFGESVFEPDAEALIRLFLEAGYEELDTAYVYNEGASERLIGAALKTIGRERVKIATKVNPRITGRLDGAAARQQLTESLERLQIEAADLFYLHFPDPATPVEDVLETCDALHREGKFRELGLSNFPAWMVADVQHICRERGWIGPTVYEGIYNPLTRRAEGELAACLRHFGMRFYAYNPLAGGLLSGRYTSFEEGPGEGRFTNRPNYQGRYWKPSFFEAAAHLTRAAEQEGLSLVEAVLRWLCHHSMLEEDKGDGVILGASRAAHLEQNLKAAAGGALSRELCEAFREAWEISRPDSPEYFTLYGGKEK